MLASKEVTPLLCQTLAAHDGAEADEAQRARHDDGNPTRPERHIDAVEGDGPPHHNPDQLQKCDQRKDGGGKRAKGFYGHCPSPMAREDMLVPAAKMGTDRRGGHSPGQEIGLTEPRSICRTIAVSLRRVWGSLRPCHLRNVPTATEESVYRGRQEKIGTPSKQRK
jgi:hypothetical protein